MDGKNTQVLDCTIRDGGLINKHHFDHRLVREVYKAVSASGVDYIELGYRNSKEMFSPDEYGLWKFTTDEDIKKIVKGIKSNIKIAVMTDIGRVNMDDFKPAKESPVSMIRTAAYVKDIDKAVYMSNHFNDLGYETAINIMAISRDSASDELDDGLNEIETDSRVKIVNIVDSFGHLQPRAVVSLMERFKKHLKTKLVGFHAHNHLQLGFGNTIEAIQQGADSVDGTVYGIGRAAGNCPIELLIGYLKHRRFDIAPVLELISKEFIQLRKEIEWGYIIPYAITGMLNEHPRTAMALRESKNKDNYREFYEKISSGYMD